MGRESILTVGSLNMDEVVQVARLPVMGETLLGAGALRLVPGGKGANQAVAMARLGASVRLAGRIGKDPFGAQLLQSLQIDNVDTSLVVQDEHEASGVALIFLSPQGDNAIVVASGANARMGEDALQMQHIFATLPEAQALVLQMEIPLTTVEALVTAGHEAGVPVVLNLAPAQILPLETLRQLDTLIVNESEACLLLDALNGTQTPGTAIRDLSCASLLAHSLQSRGIARVVITLGAQGAMAAYAGSTTHVPAPRVQVVDTTAAGDCFVGALTVALSEGQEIGYALHFAVHASALKVTKFGAQSGLPTRTEVEALLRAQT